MYVYWRLSLKPSILSYRRFMKRWYTFRSHHLEVAMNSMPTTKRIHGATSLPTVAFSTKNSSNGTPNAPPAMRFYKPVPTFCRPVILALRSSVLLLYTANWNRQKYTAPGTNIIQAVHSSTDTLPVTIPGINSTNGMMSAMLYKMYLARNNE